MNPIKTLYRLQDLAASPVVFLAQEHRYYYPDGAKYLSGITSMLHRQLFPDMYADIPQAVLDAAAERGSLIHAECQALAEWGDAGTRPETAAYAQLLAEKGIRPIACEYTVSDLAHFASQIDMVDDRLNLYDLKTTAVLNLPYVAWQLSVYAYLFELQNPGLKAGRLYVIHLTRDGKARLVEVQRVAPQIVARLLDEDAAGLPFVCDPQEAFPAELDEDEQTHLAHLAEIEAGIVAIKTSLKEAEERKKRLCAGLLERMKDRNLYSLSTPGMTLTRVDETAVETLDGKRLKDELPDVYAKYRKLSSRAAYVKITLKKQTEKSDISCLN